MEDKYIFSQGKRLRCGYTTGTCAQAAARAAATGLFTGEIPQSVEIKTADGTKLVLPVEEPSLGTEKQTGRAFAVCAVRKDAGDDIDVTDGMLVFARVTFQKDSGSMLRCIGQKTGASAASFAAHEEDTAEEKKESDETERIRIEGGTGVGRVTKPGLDQPVGAAAINSVPRRMIRAEVASVMEEVGEEVPLDVEIFLPDGEERAKKTMNERLGILGGLSILGTTGIVEPQSHRALIETIRAELSMRRAAGERKLLITPGNYGMKFIENAAAQFSRDDAAVTAAQFSGNDTENATSQLSKKDTEKAPLFHPEDIGNAVKCSNFIGDTLDAAMEFGFLQVTLVGHIGKLVKLAGGMMNTHSMYGDCRMDLLAACGLKAGVPREALERIQDCVTCDDALGILAECDALKPAMKQMEERILYHLNYRCKGNIALRVIVFSNIYGVLVDADME